VGAKARFTSTLSSAQFGGWARRKDNMTSEPKLDFSLTFEERADYLFAFVTGPKDSLAVSNACWGQIHSKVTELGITKLLVLEDFPNQLAFLEMYQAAEFIAKTFGSAVKIAHVDKQLSDEDLNKLAEDVVVIMGTNGRTFNRLEDAENWLSK